jgi:hypothetical protein
MKPLFTIHAGEYLLASYIEHRWHKLNVWVPSRDTGVDLLVSDHDNRKTVSLQVKFSKDYLFTHLGAEFQKPFRAFGWWTINKNKLRDSRADFWVLLQHGFKRHTTDFIVVPRQELGERLTSLRGPGVGAFQVYLLVRDDGKRCWEIRDLKPKNEHLRLIARGEYTDDKRNFTRWLNNWDPIIKLLGGESDRAVAAHS